MSYYTPQLLHDSFDTYIHFVGTATVLYAIALVLVACTYISFYRKWQDPYPNFSFLSKTSYPKSKKKMPRRQKNKTAAARPDTFYGRHADLDLELSDEDNEIGDTAPDMSDELAEALQDGSFDMSSMLEMLKMAAGELGQAGEQGDEDDTTGTNPEDLKHLLTSLQSHMTGGGSTSLSEAEGMKAEFDQMVKDYRSQLSFSRWYCALRPLFFLRNGKMVFNKREVEKIEKNAKNVLAVPSKELFSDVDSASTTSLEDNAGRLRTWKNKDLTAEEKAALTPENSWPAPKNADQVKTLIKKLGQAVAFDERGCLWISADGDVLLKAAKKFLKELPVEANCLIGWVTVTTNKHASADIGGYSDALMNTVVPAKECFEKALTARRKEKRSKKQQINEQDLSTYEAFLDDYFQIREFKILKMIAGMCAQLKAWGEALSWMLEGSKCDDATEDEKIDQLNEIGFCYEQIGQTRKAKEAWLKYMDHWLPKLERHEVPEKSKARTYMTKVAFRLAQHAYEHEGSVPEGDKWLDIATTKLYPQLNDAGKSEAAMAKIGAEGARKDLTGEGRSKKSNGSFKPKSRTTGAPPPSGAGNGSERPPVVKKFELGDVVEIVRAQKYVGERGEIVSGGYKDANDVPRVKVELKYVSGVALDEPKEIAFQAAHLDLVYSSTKATEIQLEFEQDAKKVLSHKKRFCVGDEVAIVDLVKRADLNGRRGLIRKPISMFRPRYGVQVLPKARKEGEDLSSVGEDEIVHVLPKNLKRIWTGCDSDSTSTATTSMQDTTRCAICWQLLKENTKAGKVLEKFTPHGNQYCLDCVDAFVANGLTEDKVCIITRDIADEQEFAVISKVTAERRAKSCALVVPGPAPLKVDEQPQLVGSNAAPKLFQEFDSGRAQAQHEYAKFMAATPEFFHEARKKAKEGKITNEEALNVCKDDYHKRRLEMLRQRHAGFRAQGKTAYATAEFPADAAVNANNYMKGCCAEDGSDDPVIQRACDVKKNQLDKFGDGDQSALTVVPGGPGADLEQYWSTGGTFNPFQRPMEYSALLRAASWGSVREVQAILESIKDEPREVRVQYLEFRESSLRMTPLLGLVTGSRSCDLTRGVVCPAYLWPNPPKKRDVDHVKCAKLLLEAGANPDCRDILGKTPLMQCCNSMATTTSLAVAEVLVEFNADLAPLCRLGNCLLMEAVNTGRTDCVKKMLDLGVDPNLTLEVRMGGMMPRGMRMPNKLMDFPFRTTGAQECQALLRQAAAKGRNGGAGRRKK